MTKPTIMMIGGGIQQIKAVQAAQRCGYRVLVSDRSETSPCFEFADFTAVLDGRNVEELIAYTALHKNELNIQGIFTLTELVTSVATVATATGLPGVSVLSAVSCQNKQLSKQAWLKSGISTPQGKMVGSKEEATAFLTDLSGKVILKPIIGFGGKGIIKASSPSDLDQYDFSKGPAIIETHIDGSMHDVNGVFDRQGHFVPLGCFDRTFATQNPLETGAVYPSQLLPEQLKQAYALTEHAARAVGINWGPVKSDLVLSADGFMILELAPRLHGPKGTLYLTAMVDGQNHLERIFDVLTDMGDVKAPKSDPAQQSVATYEIIEHPGKPFSNVENIDVLSQSGAEILLLNRSSSTTAYTDNTEVVGYVFGSGDNVKVLKTTLKTVQTKLTFS
ncbi:MAG: ATP-grasp domain-containing protein [Magnetovibrio sp.]|nr:ATP-grasp domain-containing protein [Magnetovibrio sp.]